MEQWHQVALTSEIPADTGKIVEIGEAQIALFKVDGRIHAINNLCPHRAGPLGAGGLENGVVMCPWHGWQFDVRTGKSPDISAAQVVCFKVKVEGEEVWVEV